VSGGRYRYAYERVQEMADAIEASLAEPPGARDTYGDPRYVSDYRAERRAFARHLRETAEAMRALEWYDSGDADQRRWLEQLRGMGVIA
jgi:hypothetical protein